MPIATERLPRAARQMLVSSCGTFGTAHNSWFRLRPVLFSLDEADFTGSPTRWPFVPSPE